MGIRISLLLLVMPLILLGITDNAFANMSGDAGSDIDNADFSQLVFDFDDPEGSVSIASGVNACDPVSDCPPIVKNFNFEETSGSLFLHEEWDAVNGGTVDWTDWHEVIITPEWTFQKVQIQKNVGNVPCPDPDSANPIPNPLPPDVIMNNGKEIWIDFADNIGLVSPGERICIVKEVSVPTTFSGTLTIYEWPTIHKFAVGGDIIPLDSTMVLTAGAQYTAAWMIPVIVSGIGIAVYLVKRRF